MARRGQRKMWCQLFGTAWGCWHVVTGEMSGHGTKLPIRDVRSSVADGRDQGLEAYRAWFPASFYRGTGIGDVSIGAFSDDEAKALVEDKPNLQRLLFGSPSVREIARRPFFAAVIARSFPDNDATPQTEVDLIKAWWDRAGHDAPDQMVPQRHRALLDIAEKGKHRGDQAADSCDRGLRPNRS